MRAAWQRRRAASRPEAPELEREEQASRLVQNQDREDQASRVARNPDRNAGSVIAKMPPEAGSRAGEAPGADEVDRGGEVVRDNEVERGGELHEGRPVRQGRVT